MIRQQAAIVILLSIVFAPMMRPEQTWEADSEWIPNLREIKHIRSQIVAELSSIPGHPWAGIYSYGGRFFGGSLAVAPHHGFVEMNGGCLGLTDAEYGTVTALDNGFRLVHQNPESDWRKPGETMAYTVLRWGKRRYLVESNHVLNFCNAVNARSANSDTLDKFYFVRVEDAKLKISGLPQVPTKYLPYLLHEPIEGRVIEIGERQGSSPEQDLPMFETPMRLGIGSSAGVLVGLTFHFSQLTDLLTRFEVEGVAPDECWGTLRQHGKSAHIVPELGWLASTRRQADASDVW